MEIDLLTDKIIDAAMEVHQMLGPGLLEEVYKQCLKTELGYRNLEVLSEVPLPVYYKDLTMDIGYRLDLIVEDRVIVEIKAVSRLLPVHRAQLYTYLKLTDKFVGLLLNFNTRLLKEGITRVEVHNYR